MNIRIFHMAAEASKERGGYRWAALRQWFPDTGRQHYFLFNELLTEDRPLGPALEHAQNAVLESSVTSVGTVYVIGATAWFDDGETFVEWPEFLGFECQGENGNKLRDVVDAECDFPVPAAPTYRVSPELLVQIMRSCASPEGGCENCPLDGMMMPYCHDWVLTRAVELIEAQAKRIGSLEEELRWIPVSERKPETVPCGVGTEYSEAVSVLTTGRKVLAAVWNGSEWLCDRDYWEAWGEEITHWRSVLPLPKEGA